MMAVKTKKKNKPKIVGKYILHNLAGVTFEFKDESIQRLRIKKNQDFLVNEDQMSELISHPYWKQLITQNYLQKLEIGSINPEEVLFAESSLTEAVINDCTDLKQLQELAKNAYTKKLKVLILNRVEELQTMLDELKNVFPKPQLSEVLKTGNAKEIKEAIERATLADIDTLKALMNDDRVEIKNAVAEKVQQLIDENK